MVYSNFSRIWHIAKIVVTLKETVSDDVLKQTVTEQGYKVLDIQERPDTILRYLAMKAGKTTIRKAQNMPVNWFAGPV